MKRIFICDSCHLMIRSINMMERLVVEADGTVVIPHEVISRRGLRPGDNLSLIEVAEGFLVFQDSLDTETATWLEGLSEEERHLVEVEALHYEALSGKEKEAIWGEG